MNSSGISGFCGAIATIMLMIAIASLSVIVYGLYTGYTEYFATAVWVFIGSLFFAVVFGFMSAAFSGEDR